MKTKLRYTIFLVALLLCKGQSTAQNFVQDFKAINKAYTVGDISFNIRFDYYNDYKSSKPNYFYTGMVKLKGNLIYYKINGIEYSYDSIYTSLIDHNSKTIMIDTIRNKPNVMSRINFIDSLANCYERIEYKELDNNCAKYSIYSHLPGISHSEIVFNKETKLIKKITIYFLDLRENAVKGSIRNKLEISYTNINTDAKNSLEYFRIQRIVDIKQRRVVAKPLYSRYEIINNME